MEALLERLKREYSEAVEAVTRFAPAILNVAPASMVEFLVAVRAEYGSYPRLAEHLEVSEAVKRLRVTLLEAA
jgi:hypothetical protein